MKINELLQNKDLYRECPDEGTLYPQDGYVFRLDEWKTDYLWFYATLDDRYYVVITSDGMKFTIKEDTEIHIVKDIMEVECQLTMKQDHNDQWFFYKERKFVFGYCHDPDIELKLIESLVDLFQAKNIDILYKYNQIEFNVNLRGCFEDTVYDLVSFGLISKEQFVSWYNLYQ
jgi:hypothetical protein